MDKDNILQVEDLHVTFSTYGGTVKAVRGVHLHLKKERNIGHCWGVWLWKKCHIQCHYAPYSQPTWENYKRTNPF